MSLVYDAPIVSFSKDTYERIKENYQELFEHADLTSSFQRKTSSSKRQRKTSSKKPSNSKKDLTFLDTEMLQNQLLFMDPIDLTNLCSTNKKLKEICDQDFFWERKYVLDFGESLENQPPKSPSETWKSYYSKRYNPERSLIQTIEEGDNHPEMYNFDLYDFYLQLLLTKAPENIRSATLIRGLQTFIDREAFYNVTLLSEVFEEIHKKFPQNKIYDQKKVYDVLCALAQKINSETQQQHSQSFQDIVRDNDDTDEIVSRYQRSSEDLVILFQDLFNYLTDVHFLEFYQDLLLCVLSSENFSFFYRTLAAIKSSLVVRHNEVLTDIIDKEVLISFITDKIKGNKSKIFLDIVQKTF